MRGGAEGLPRTPMTICVTLLVVPIPLALGSTYRGFWLARVYANSLLDVGTGRPPFQAVLELRHGMFGLPAGSVQLDKFTKLVRGLVRPPPRFVYVKLPSWLTGTSARNGPVNCCVLVASACPGGTSH